MLWSVSSVNKTRPWSITNMIAGNRNILDFLPHLPEKLIPSPQTELNKHSSDVTAPLIPDISNLLSTFSQTEHITTRM